MKRRDRARKAGKFDLKQSRDNVVYRETPVTAQSCRLLFAGGFQPAIEILEPFHSLDGALRQRRNHRQD